MYRSRLTEEQVQEIKELALDDVPTKEIAQRYDRAPSVINYILHGVSYGGKGEVPRRASGPKPRIKDKDKETIKDMVALGYSRKEIAERIECSVTMITKAIKEIELDVADEISEPESDPD